MKHVFYILLGSFFLNFAFAQDIIINELMSSNHSVLLDKDGDFSDWIEILNTSSSPVNLDEYALTDNDEELTKWEFPDTVILPGHYFLIFASGKDESENGHELHTNFGIKSSGEDIFFTHQGIVIQQVGAKALNNDKSYGFYPEVSGDMIVFNSSTPGYSNDSTQSTNVDFSHIGGFYPNSFYLELSTFQNNSKIYYTTDGTEPDTLSLLYSNSLYLDASLMTNENISQIESSPETHNFQPLLENVPKNIIIRAASFDALGNQISKVVTNSFFIEEIGVHIPDLPILSIAGNYKDFFSDTIGVLVPGIHFDPTNPEWSGNYYLGGDLWEREINLEYFENDKSYINQICGVRTHGGNSRRGPQKGLKFYARNEYSNNKFNFQFFTDKESSEFKRLVAKPISSSWSQSGIEDYLTSQISQNLNVDYSSAKPCAMYINGEYWGIYFLQEKIDEKYINQNYPTIEDSCVEIAESWLAMAEYGTGVNLYNYIKNNDLSIIDNYNYVNDRMDIENFIDYQLLEIFIANYDWPANNMRCWKSSCYDNKWRWIIFDGDAALQNYEFDGFSQATSLSSSDWPTNAESSLFLRKLLANEYFKSTFFERLEILLQGPFKTSFLDKKYQSIKTTLMTEINSQIGRFSYPQSMESWENDLFSLRDFIYSRPCIIGDQVLERYNISIELNSCKTNCSSLSNLKVFPNPTQGVCAISIETKAYANAEITCYDLTGKNVFSINSVLIPGLNKIDNIPLKTLPTGVYLISVDAGNCKINSKLVVMR